VIFLSFLLFLTVCNFTIKNFIVTCKYKYKLTTINEKLLHYATTSNVLNNNADLYSNLIYVSSRYEASLHKINIFSIWRLLRNSKHNSCRLFDYNDDAILMHFQSAIETTILEFYKEKFFILYFFFPSKFNSVNVYNWPNLVIDY
jgi:hypothetical protein